MARPYTEPKISISGRVDPRSAALAAAFISKQGEIFSRSDLVSACFDIVAGIAEQTTDLDVPDQYEEAFAILRRLGLEWKGKLSAQQQLRALQQDALADLEPDQIEEMTQLLNKFRRKRKRDARTPKSALVQELEALDDE